MNGLNGVKRHVNIETASTASMTDMNSLCLSWFADVPLNTKQTNKIVLVIHYFHFIKINYLVLILISIYYMFTLFYREDS